MLGGLIFKVANPAEQALAVALRAQVYIRDLGTLPKDELDQTAHHLVALNETGEVVGAVRLVGPEGRPFDLEQFVPLSSFLPEGNAVGLIGRLCVRPDYRTVSQRLFVQAGILKLTYLFSRRRQITDLIMYTYPNLINFYRGALFSLVGISFAHPYWGDVHVMHLDLQRLHTRCTTNHSPLSNFLLAPAGDNFIINET